MEEMHDTRLMFNLYFKLAYNFLKSGLVVCSKPPSAIIKKKSLR